MSTRPERADAARNRARVLEAAEQLFAERPPQSVTMEDIGRAAGVGKGTLYRRFPSREAIALALLDQHERDLQQEMISGPPPLGPGAPPAKRLTAFYAAMLTLLEQHGHLALAAETGERRYSTGAYDFWRTHVAALIRESDPAADVQPLIDILLAPLAPELYRYQRTQRRISQRRILAGLTTLAERTLA